MIKLQNLTPEVYYKKSRDFQYIGRLYDLLFNSVKTNADLIYNIPFNENSDTRLLDLLSLTLGFKSKHEYNIKQLASVCSIFAKAIKIKGSLASIKLIGDAIVNSEGLTGLFDCYVDPMDSANIIITVPTGLSDVSLLLDLLNYVMPAGMTYTLIMNVASTNNNGALTSAFENKAYPLPVRNWNANEMPQDFTGLDAARIGRSTGTLVNSLVIKPGVDEKENK